MLGIGDVMTTLQAAEMAACSHEVVSSFPPDITLLSGDVRCEIQVVDWEMDLTLNLGLCVFESL